MSLKCHNLAFNNDMNVSLASLIHFFQMTIVILNIRTERNISFLP